MLILVPLKFFAVRKAMVLTPSTARDRKTEATPIIMNILFFWDTLSATEVINRVIGVGTGGVGGGGDAPPHTLFGQNIASHIVLHKKFLMEFLPLQLSHSSHTLT